MVGRLGPGSGEAVASSRATSRPPDSDGGGAAAAPDPVKAKSEAGFCLGNFDSSISTFQ